jgi:thioredoxin reductase
MGAGDAGANMALAITYWAEKVIYINHEGTPVSKQLLRKLTEKQIEMHEDRISSILADHSCFQGVQLKDGQRIYAEKGFLAFGGNLVRSQLAGELGVKLHHNRHILADSRTKMTNVKYVWAAGDIAAHSEQVTIAMGDGSQAAIWIHKSLVAD